MTTIQDSLESLDASHQALYLSNYRISAVILSLSNAQTEYNSLGDTEKRDLLAELFLDTYESLGSLLTRFQTIYLTP